MNFDLWSAEFPHWYIAIFEIVWGVAINIWPGFMMNLDNDFRRELKDPQFGARFRAVLDRRAGIEMIPRVPWRIVGGASFVLGVLTALGLLLPIVSYAFLCLALGIVTVSVLLRLRNRSDRRAASLAPRTSSRFVPRWLYAAAGLDALTPLAFLSVPKLALAAAIVALVSVLLIVGSFIASGMAAILTGEDTGIEVAVEDRMRALRVGRLVMLAIGMPFVFFSMSVPAMPPVRGPVLVAYLVDSLIGAAAFTWFWLQVMRKAKPIDGAHAL